MHPAGGARADFSQARMIRDGWTVVAPLDLGPQVPAIFAIGNGFIGIRAETGTDDLPRVYLNGVYDRVPIEYHEGAHGLPRGGDVRLSVADGTKIVIGIDGTLIAIDAPLELDMERGVLRQVVQHGDATITLTRFASMTEQALAGCVVDVIAGASPIELTIAGEIDAPRLATPPADIDDPRITQAMANPWSEVAVPADPISCRADRLERSDFTVAVARSAPVQVRIPAGEARRMPVLTAYLAERETPADELAARARTLIGKATAAGADALLAEQAQAWSAIWAGTRFTLADPVAEGALRHGLFQIAQAVRRDGRGSIAAKGQTGEGYEGHIFWDAETYALPFLIHTQPAMARAALAWRVAGLDAARQNARDLGHEAGAVLPWRTIGGRECSSYFLAGSAQYHINADVAHALRLYVETTGDLSILREGGAELLAETARIWLSAGWHDPARGDAFVINRVTGPDEYTALIDNNLYTNLMAAEHMRYAALLEERHGIDPGLSPSERQAMLRAADTIFLPFDEARQVFAQDDAFFGKQPWPIDDTPADKFPLLLHYHPLHIYRHCVCKQADAVLAVATLPHRFAPDMRKRMLDVYEALTVHDSTLSASSFAAAAALAGETDRAAHYWTDTVLTDLLNLHANTAHGLHMAALGGGWNALAFGFAGLSTLDGSLAFSPRTHPVAGDYELGVQFHGRAVTLKVANGKASYAVDGEPLALTHWGETVTVGATPVTLDLPA